MKSTFIHRGLALAVIGLATGTAACSGLLPGPRNEYLVFQVWDGPNHSITARKRWDLYPRASFHDVEHVIPLLA